VVLSLADNQPGLVRGNGGVDVSLGERVLPYDSKSPPFSPPNVEASGYRQRLLGGSPSPGVFTS
jgi:hypothetical protein